MTVQADQSGKGRIGMSLPMIERYCRFADKKANGKAAVLQLRRLER